jgi:type IV pilus assembly protein PilQ
MMMSAHATEIGAAQAAPVSLVAAAPAAAAPATSAAAKPIEVTGVDVQELSAGGVVVIMKGNGPIATYESFMLPDPPRLVVDIPNAVHAIPQPIKPRPPVVTAIRSSQYRERPVQIVRVVMDLRADMPFRAVPAQDQLRVEVGTAEAASAPGGATKAGPQAAAAAPAAPTKAAGKVTRVDVQNVRGRQQIVIRTSGAVAYKVTDSTAPLGVSVDVTGASIEPGAARTVDLRQVASPISQLQAFQHQTEPEQVVRVAAELRGPTRYDVRQTPAAIIVDFMSPPRTAGAPSASPVSVAPSAAPAPPVVAQAPAAPAAAVGAAPAAPPPGNGKLSMDFKDADINNLLRIIAEVSGKNVVAGSDVQGKVTVRLINVEWEQALDVILRVNNFAYEMDGNVIRVAPASKLAAEERAREEAKQRKLERERKERAEALKEQKEEKQLEPLRDEVIPVNYAKPSDVVKALDRLKTPGRTDASVSVDERTSRVIIRETEAGLARMKGLLREIDRPTPQVLIEARLIEATRGFSQSLGIEWGFAAQVGGKTSIFGAPGGLIEPSTAVPFPLAISTPATSPTAAVGTIARGLFNDRLAIGARISAGESENKVRTLSAPKVATVDNQEAEIKQGQQVPYTTIDSSGRTVVAYVDAFIRLKVTPHFTNDKRISMKVEAERSFPGDRIDFPGGFSFPINTRKATTNVLVSNGATVVLGGLLQSDERWSESRVPWISKVPVFGSLFKSTSIGPEGKIELLIFLTPTILEEPRVS